MVQTTDDPYHYREFHEAQLKSAGVPTHFWPSLFDKLENQIFDSAQAFALLKIDYEGRKKAAEEPDWTLQISSEDGLKHSDGTHIYLVDHAWTFQIDGAKKQLREMPELVTRLGNIAGLTEEPARIDELFDKLWKYTQTYTILNSSCVENNIPICYVMDELGSAINHSDSPNFRSVPFFQMPLKITYSLIFPIKDVAYGDTVTRDFAEGIVNIFDRKAVLMPVVKSDLSELDFNQVEPDEPYFLSGHIQESLPAATDNQIQLPSDRKIKVFSHYFLVNKHLTDKRFELTSDQEDADIWWYCVHFKKFSELSKTPNKLINQFPFEHVITIKDLLAVVCRRSTNTPHDLQTLETYPNWLPTTYNLKTELPKFISYYQARAKQNKDNYWICKPFNLARGLDTHITDNLDLIIKLSGPKIAQKYIHQPVLFTRDLGKVKFDIRYVILLNSVQPLQAYVYKNFFLRFSNVTFEMKDFDNYEKHFTVMNYDVEESLYHLPCAQFLEKWQEQYPDFPWRDIESDIVKMLKQCFENAVRFPAPRGIAHNSQSRAVYAADIMLSWDNPNDGSLLPYMQPKLLEINWTPDCERACKYYPDFYNDIFACLFLNDRNTDMFIPL